MGISAEQHQAGDVDLTPVVQHYEPAGLAVGTRRLRYGNRGRNPAEAGCLVRCRPVARRAGARPCRLPISVGPGSERGGPSRRRPHSGRWNERRRRFGSPVGGRGSTVRIGLTGRTGSPLVGGWGGSANRSAVGGRLYGLGCPEEAGSPLVGGWGGSADRSAVRGRLYGWGSADRPDSAVGAG